MDNQSDHNKFTSEELTNMFEETAEKDEEGNVKQIRYKDFAKLAA